MSETGMRNFASPGASKPIKRRIPEALTDVDDVADSADRQSFLTRGHIPTAID